MKPVLILTGIILLSFILSFSACKQGQSESTSESKDTSVVEASAPTYGGFESEVAWGKHIVTIAGCNDCHTPKKMGPNGPEDDMDMLLSGHPSQMPTAFFDRKDMEKKGLVVINGFTEFAGPWGISYSANLTPDSLTGIGTWTPEQFIRTVRTGKFAGAPNGRNILPPMPWPNVAQMTDDELKAVFSYLQSIKPVHNVVPPPQPPALVMKKS